MSKLKNELSTDFLMTISWSDLLELEKNMHKVIEKRRTVAKTDIMRQLEQISLTNGFTIDELFGQQVVTKLKIKYRSTENPKDIWTGRGKTPVWLRKMLDSGRKLEEFVV